MKNIFVLMALLCGLPLVLSAQEKEEDKYIESDVIPLAGKKGFSIQTRSGDFIFKPFVLLQTALNVNYYDDEGLNLADQDNIANSGFAIPNAILGVSGKVFGKLTFNLTLNAAQAGNPALLQQAWFDVNLKDQLRFRIGKFKTPYNQAYLVTLGETLFPMLPMSLTAPVNLGRSINSVPPNFATGFDLGVMMHGTLWKKIEYNVGIFNGTGINVNTSRKTMSDDLGIPSLLYSARIAFMPKGIMPSHQGNIDDLADNKLLFALSSSYNVEANWQSSNDFRMGFEFAWLLRRWYFSAEAYYMNMQFVKNQKSDAIYDFWGGYAQAGYFVTRKLQAALRYDLLDRNALQLNGLLNAPTIGLNYFLFGYKLKFQAMYQYLGKYGHKTQIDRDNDDLGLAQHAFTATIQFSF